MLARSPLEPAEAQLKQTMGAHRGFCLILLTCSPLSKGFVCRELMPLQKGVLFMLATILCCANAGQGQAPTEPLEGLAWVVQVSDLHLSAFNYLPDQYAHFGDKEGDLRCVRGHTWLRNEARAGSL